MLKLGTFEPLDSNPRRKRPAREVTDSYRTSFTPHFSMASMAQSDEGIVAQGKTLPTETFDGRFPYKDEAVGIILVLCLLSTSIMGCI